MFRRASGFIVAIVPRLLYNSRMVIAYCRTSTTKQDVSLEAQESKIRAWCHVKGLEISEVIVDGDEFSGNLDRPGMKRLLSLVNAGAVSHVAIYKLDRMTRSVADAISLMELFNKRQVCFLSVMESLDTQSPMGVFFVQMIAAIAELERKIIGERTKAALQHIKASGCPAGHAPYGWTSQPRPEGQNGKKLRVPMIENPAEQQTIRVIMDLHRQGESLREIANQLNDAGYRTRRGGKWMFTGVANIVREHR